MANAPQVASRQKAFELFVKSPIASIQKEAWGRSKEVRDIREVCQKFLTLYESEGSSCSEDLILQALNPLRIACASSHAKIAELALGSIHKLVSMAWLSGESTSSGSMDNDDMVAAVIKMVLKSSESNNQAVQLAVVQALLTITTAEHFVAHGDCLLAAVRAVFNVALSSDHAFTKQRACNALLQMLNTIARRVTQLQPLRSSNSALPSYSATPYGGSRNPSMGGGEPDPMSPSDAHIDSPEKSAHHATAQELPPIMEGPGSEIGTPRTAQPSKEARESGREEANGQGEGSTDVDAEHAATEKPAQEAAGTPSSPPPPATPTGTANGSSLAVSPGKVPEALSGIAMASAFSDMAADESLESETPGGSPTRKSQLTTMERDVLQVLIAFCKLASREPASGSSESFLHQGKVLALELLVKVFQNPLHSWEAAREEFTHHLRQPLCITLLRNVSASDPATFQLAVKLLVIILTLPKLRHGLKAELGAFFPLLVLTPLEQDSPDIVNVQTTLSALRTICNEAQLVVDLFVNYDCDLHAANLFERTIQALSRIARQQPDPNFQGNAQAKAEYVQKVAANADTALHCIISVVAAMDAWAGPIKDSSARLVEVDSGDLPLNFPVADAAATEAERFGAAKAQKSSLNKGLTLFNKNPIKGMSYLVSSGVVEHTPQSVAAFLRSHGASLDKTAIGEYLGHHDDFEVAVMHAYVDKDAYGGLPIDVALRRLLHEFRLPGEAQKIDRIMEKFAERYCRDNPGKFRTAGAPYVLSFSIIMLNTDAHNPMVDRRIQKPDFVAMNVHEVDGELEATLNADELEAIYDRIVANQIVVRDASHRASEESKSWHMKLAATLGLTQLTAPLRPTVAAGQKRRNLNAEKQKVLSMVEQAVKSTAAAGNTWFVATHAEHTSPMLQVSGELIYEALSSSLLTTTDTKTAEAVLGALVMTVKLAGLLGLGELCELFVSTLVQASGVNSPAPYGSAEAERQLAALRTLFSLALGPEAGLLGSSWPLVLRTISNLEALQVELTRPQSPGAAEAARAAAKANEGNTFSRMLQAIGLPMGGKKDSAGADGAARYIQPSTPSSLPRSPTDSLQPAVREAPGAHLVLWLETEGLPVVEQVYARSAALDGDAVLVFIRALCAVSQEELETSPPQVFSLQKLVECAYHNMTRIRLIWTRLWSVISTHLVSASCHPLNDVAMYAVDSLRQLVAKLLARAELANFTHQEEALRPFVSILKQCDDVGVRELTVRCITQAITAHPRGLGSGWRMVLEALTQGAADTGAAVITQSLEALQVVTEALFRGPGIGHDCFRECVRATMSGVRNQYHPEQSIQAVQLLLRCGRRLAERTTPAAPTGEAEGVLETRLSQGQGPSDDGWPLLLRTLLDVLTNDTRPRVTNTSMEVVFELMHLYSMKWDEEAWQILLNQVLGLLFKPPEDPSTALHGSDTTDEAAASAFLSRIDRYFPQMCDQMSKVTPGLRLDLLGRLAEISLYMYGHRSEQMAAAGLHGIHRLVTALAGRMDSAGWALMISQLEGVVQSELALIIPGASIYTAQYAAAFSLPRPAPTEPFPTLSPEQLARFRTRCRMLLQLQKCLDQVHEQCAPHMEPDTQVAVVKLLQSILDSVMDFNTREGPMVSPSMDPLPPSTSNTATSALTSNGDAPHSTNAPSANGTSTLLPSTDPSSPTSATATALSPRSESEITDGPSLPHIATSQPGTAPPSPSPASTTTTTPLASAPQTPNGTPLAANPPGITPDSRFMPSSPAKEYPIFPAGSRPPPPLPNLPPLPDLVLSSPACYDPLTPALMRLETEGGILLLAALVRTTHSLKSPPPQSPSSPKSSTVAATPSMTRSTALATVEAMLARLCDRIITSAAEAASRNAYIPPAAALAKPMQIIEVRASVTWDHAVRAPLVAHALEAFHVLGEGGDHRQQLADIFPKLAHLVCYGHPAVQRALAKLVTARVGPMLEEVLSSAA